MNVRCNIEMVCNCSRYTSYVKNDYNTHEVNVGYFFIVKNLLSPARIELASFITPVLYLYFCTTETSGLDKALN